jgi:hypothetical protein
MWVADLGDTAGDLDAFIAGVAGMAAR